ncbi:MAG TPA: 16S rRNA (cytidine(1402)-2'-O)-methyltransferase [Mollicutes bacterium]|nr:16S rRNA (cytidine(1402)-2'-O)-methyltransferase [Mollicutes bacterium]
MNGKLFVVATPIGNLKDISQNAIETLNVSDLIAAEDTRVTINLLRHFDIKTKLVSYHKFNEKMQSQKLIEEMMKGKNICLVTDAGTPCISDPGSILVREAIDRGIEVIGIPGPSAVITGLSISGFDISSFSFYGFLAKEKKKFNEALNNIKNDSSKIAVIYESPKRVVNTLKQITETLNNPKVCVCNDLTKKFEKKYYGSCDEVIEMLNNNQNHELGEYVIIIEKNEMTFTTEYTILSIEADLVDAMIKNNCTMKEAIKIVSSNRKKANSKSEVYEASLKVKEMFLDNIDKNK